MSKLCGKCKAVKPSEAFARANKRADGLQHACKACNRAYRQENAEKVRQCMNDWYHRVGWERRLKLSYGVPPGWYAITLEAQGGVCAICQEPPPDTKRLCVDHDRSCCSFEPNPSNPICGNCVRSLVCNGCNTKLGTVEQADWLKRAQRYIKAHRDGLDDE